MPRPRPPPPPRALVPGPLREDRGQLHAIAALAALHRDGVAATLLLAGDPAAAPEYARRCRQRITAAALDDHVQWLAPDALLSELPRADLLLSPAPARDLPLALKEAMAPGVLLGAPPPRRVPEPSVDAVSGLLPSATSVDALVLALRRAIPVPADARHRLVAQACRVARADLHPQRAASDLFAMYLRALDLTAAARPA